MATIPVGIFRMAAELYRVPGTTWMDVVRQLQGRGIKIDRSVLVFRVKQGNYLNLKPGQVLCPSCKTAFIPNDRTRGRAAKCDDCKEAAPKQPPDPGFSAISQKWLSRKLCR